MTSDEVVGLPRILVASNGREEWSPPVDGQVGILLRHTDLPSLPRHAEGGYPVAVDIDSIAGLADDPEAADHVVLRLGFRFVLTRSPATAAHVAMRGGIGFLRVFAVDSTGLSSALKRHPRVESTGSAISPAVVLPRLRAEELVPIPRPLIAYGLLDRPADIAAALTLADSIVLSTTAFESAQAGRGQGGS